ncbi:hypothetical protein [Pseudomonas sp. PLB05]|jgi:hypothetical protein|uniref:hypothetical protein n=1 Tax=Pseudomonas sp. PLB05 TaxID=2899078 RepID=UPI003FA6DD1F
MAATKSVRAAQAAQADRDPPPFTVVGIEYRSGKLLLSVAPPGSIQLSELYLVRPGDNVGGTRWRLANLNDRQAQFSVDGVTRRGNPCPQSPLPASLAVALILISLAALALTADQAAPQVFSGETGSAERQSAVQGNDSAVAPEWGLSSQEFQRYHPPC